MTINYCSYYKNEFIMIQQKKIKTILFFLMMLPAIMTLSQVHDEDNYCWLNCDPNIHLENTDVLYQLIQLDSVQRTLEALEIKKFPLRFVILKEKFALPNDQTKKELNDVVMELNKSFMTVGFHFYIDTIEVLESDIKLEDLAQNQNNIYDKFSQAYDKADLITMYVLGHKTDFCTIANSRISCSKIGGFSYILSGRANNIVMSSFDLHDPKIVAHEFGHFFGLYHTFEQNMFGRDQFIEGDCYITGDRICDTPPDPGTIFELYVNYSKCEMVGFENEAGISYKPIIENFMSYYKPCYLKAYSFTKEQEMIMKLASHLHIRDRLTRK